jgi:hypothetical protein
MQADAKTINFPLEEAILQTTLTNLKASYILDPSWKQKYKKDGIFIHKKKDKSTGIAFVRSQGTVPLSADLLRDFLLYDGETTSQKDSNIEESRTVEVIQNKFFVYYSKTKPQFMVSARDTVVILTYTQEEADGTIILYANSCVHPACPEVKGVIRAVIHMYGWILKPCKEDPTKTEMTYLLQCDPKGKIPKTIVNSFIEEEGLILKRLRKKAVGKKITKEKIDELKKKILK